MITGHPGLGLDPPKLIGPERVATYLVVSEHRFRRFYKKILKLFVTDFEIVYNMHFAYKG